MEDTDGHKRSGRSLQLKTQNAEPQARIQLAHETHEMHENGGDGLTAKAREGALIRQCSRAAYGAGFGGHLGISADYADGRRLT